MERTEGIYTVGRTDSKRGHVTILCDGNDLGLVYADGDSPGLATVDAAHIVRCVNSHDALVAALEDCLTYAKLHWSDSQGTFGAEVTRSRIEKANAALALAKGTA